MEPFDLDECDYPHGGQYDDECEYEHSYLHTDHSARSEEEVEGRGRHHGWLRGLMLLDLLFGSLEEEDPGPAVAPEPDPPAMPGIHVCFEDYREGDLELDPSWPRILGIDLDPDWMHIPGIDLDPDWARASGVDLDPNWTHASGDDLDPNWAQDPLWVESPDFGGIDD